MASKKAKIVKIAVGFVVVACLFPPWSYTFNSPDMPPSARSAGYSLILSPPEPKRSHRWDGVRLDYGRLSIELIIIGLVGGLAIFSVSDKESDSESKTE